jgi:hypothetical protein
VGCQYGSRLNNRGNVDGGVIVGGINDVKLFV